MGDLWQGDRLIDLSHCAQVTD